MIALIIVLVALAALAAAQMHRRIRRPTRIVAPGTRRILYPFVANALSPPALDAALRLANAEHATLVPVFLTRVSLHLPLDTPSLANQRSPSRSKRRSSSARHGSGSPLTRGSSAAARTGTHSARRSPTSATTGS
jgi:hypothetical protein